MHQQPEQYVVDLYESSAKVLATANGVHLVSLFHTVSQDRLLLHSRLPWSKSESCKFKTSKLVLFAAQSKNMWKEEFDKAVAKRSSPSPFSLPNTCR